MVNGSVALDEKGIVEQRSVYGVVCLCVYVYKVCVLYTRVSYHVISLTVILHQWSCQYTMHCRGGDVHSSEGID